MRFAGFLFTIGLFLAGLAVEVTPDLQDTQLAFHLWVAAGAVFLATLASVPTDYLWKRHRQRHLDAARAPQLASGAKLRLFSGAGDLFRQPRVMPTDADLIFRIGIETTRGNSVRGVKVVIQDCEPDQPFDHDTQFRLRHEAYDTRRGFDLDDGERKYPELLDVWFSGRGAPLVKPAHATEVTPRYLIPGVYIALVVATGQQISPCEQRFKITVQADRQDPVRIEAI